MGGLAPYHGTAHLLPRERASASFDVRKLTFFIDGGPKATAHRRWLWAAGEAYDNSGNYFLSRSEIVSAHVERFIGIHKKFAEDGYQDLHDQLSHCLQTFGHCLAIV